MDPILRHVAACNNAVLPGGRLRLLLDAQHVGWVRPALAPALAALGAATDENAIRVGAGGLERIARTLSDAGHFRWRDEAFDVRATPDGPVLDRVDRGALPALGIQALGVHLNGLVRRGAETLLWVARRAADKQLDPGKLDHLVAGGVPAGLTPQQALVKEGEEEAGLSSALAAAARPVGIIEYAMERDEGLRRDRLHCYDLYLPEDFVPEPRDGEVEAFELWPLPAVLDRVRQTDDFKFNVNLVLIDLLRRENLLPLPMGEGRGEGACRGNDQLPR